MSGVPIILTANMGKPDQRWANRLRAAHFPPERNQLDAHITLFHHLPPAILPELKDRMRALARQSPPDAVLSEVYSLGTGVAFRVASPGLLAMREELAAAFHGLLTPQDSPVPRLHITVQNKVEPGAARALLAQLRADCAPCPLAIAGLAAWYYRGGPWEPAYATSFRD